MSKKSFIDSIEVKTPCSEDWDEMRGNEKIRFCSHCSKSVNNISAMTRKQAMRIVRASNGEICVRYAKSPKTNAPVFAGKLYQISRRAGIAAGVLGASLSLSALTYAQTEISDANVNRQTLEALPQVKSKSGETEDKTGNISGTIKDSNDAVIPDMPVSLTDVKTNESRSTVSNEEGFYSFENVADGIYKIKVEGGRGFAERIRGGVKVSGGNNVSEDISLNVDTEIMVAGGAMFADYDNPVARAVSNDDIEEVKNLIAKGENVNGRDENYNDITPLFLAVENGNVEMVETLLNFGAKINARDKDRQTPLMRLDEDGSAELARVLIKHGAKVNAADSEGNTALILAAQTAKAEVLQVLLDHDAQVNAQNRQGQTALMNAADADNQESVRALILAGADVNLKNKDGESAWDLTASDEIEDLLKSHAAITDDN